jgi:hypothetical protein
MEDTALKIQFITVLSALLTLSGPAALAQAEAPEMALEVERTEQVGGPDPSRGYYVAKLTQAGKPFPNFNSGRALYFYTTFQPTANRYTYGSAMTPDRVIVLAGTPLITTLGIRSDGRYDGNYTGIRRTEMEEATGFSGGRDITFGPLVNDTFFETYMVGDAAFKIAEGQFSSVLAVKWRPHPDPTDAHRFGEDGTALIFPQQLDPALDSLKALKILTTPGGSLRILAHGTDKDTDDGPKHTLWMVGVTQRGTIDTQFGENGVVRLPTEVGPLESTYAYRPHFYEATRAPSRFFVGRITRKAGRAHIEVDGFDAETGARIPSFIPIDLRIEHGTPNAFRLAVTDQRIALVATIPGTEQFQKPRRLIAMFDLFGRPNPNFSGDGKRLVELENPDLALAAAALTPSNVLYIVESLKFGTRHVGAVSKWLVDDINQGRHDTSWGDVQPFVTLDETTLRSSAGEDMSVYEMNFIFADAFIEPFASGGHSLVVTGSALVP